MARKKQNIPEYTDFDNLLNAVDIVLNRIGEYQTDEQLKENTGRLFALADKIKDNDSELTEPPEQTGDNRRDLLRLKKWTKNPHKRQQPDSKQVKWDETNPDYISSSEAITTYATKQCSLTKISKLLTPKGEIRYMRKRGKGARVHIGDFRQWAKKEYLSVADREKICDDVLSEREKQKSSIIDDNYMKLAEKIAGDS